MNSANKKNTVNANRLTVSLLGRFIASRLAKLG